MKVLIRYTKEVACRVLSLIFIAPTLTYTKITSSNIYNIKINIHMNDNNLGAPTRIQAKASTCLLSYEPILEMDGWRETHHYF